MKKIILFIALTGAIIGISAGIYYYFFISTKSTSTSAERSEIDDMFKTVTATEAARKVQDSNVLKMTIAVPKNNLFFTKENTLKFAGATRRNVVYGITGGKEVIIDTVNEDGSFAHTVTLNEGINTIDIHAYDQNGAYEKTTKTIVYLKDAITQDIEIQTGVLQVADDKIELTDGSRTTPIEVTKTTKLYSFSQNTKKALRSVTQLENGIHTAILQTKDDKKETIAVLQQPTIEPTKMMFGKVIDKTVAEDVFSLDITLLDKPESLSIKSNSKTKITSANETELGLRGSDIKIGDKILVYYESSIEEPVPYILIVPGQAAGILKDVKNN